MTVTEEKTEQFKITIRTERTENGIQILIDGDAAGIEKAHENDKGLFGTGTKQKIVDANYWKHKLKKTILNAIRNKK